MKKLLLPLALAGTLGACSNAEGVDPDAIPAAQLLAVRMTLDSAFTGTSGLYAQMSTVVFPFMDRASRIGQGSDTTRVVGVEFDVDATQNGSRLTINLSAVLAWKGYDSTSGTMDTVFFLLGAGRAPVTDSLWSRFTLDTAGTGTGFMIHQAAADTATTTWLSRGGHLHTTSSHY